MALDKGYKWMLYAYLKVVSGDGLIASQSLKHASLELV